MVVAISSDPGHLDPAITTSGGSHTAAERLYHGPVALDANGEPVSELDGSWEIEDARATYTFTLRDGATWHDGERFTSADVKSAEVLLQQRDPPVLPGHRRGDAASATSPATPNGSCARRGG